MMLLRGRRRRDHGGLDADLRARVEAAAALFEIEPDRPLTAENIVAQASVIMGLPLSLAVADLNPPGTPASQRCTGNLLGIKPDVPSIVVLDRSVAGDPVLSPQCAAHEVWHAMSNQKLLNTPVTDAELISQVPLLDPKLVVMLGARCCGKSQEPDEQASEYFGAELLRRSIPSVPRRATRSGLPGLDASLGETP